MNDTPSVCVVIPNWNGRDFIEECLNSLHYQTLQPHIIVVENGSTDNSIEIIKNKFPKVEILEYPDNAGFAGGVNRGINAALTANFKYIVLFNNDAEASQSWLKNLVNAANARPEAGIVTGKFLRMDKIHLDSAGEQYSTHAMPFPRGRNQQDKGQFNTGEYVFAATGGASLYRAKMLLDVGNFDEDFFAYFEDVDISFRAQLAGWKVWYEPSAVAFHHVSATSSKLGNFTRFHSVKNLILLYCKNMPGSLYWRYKPWFFIRLARMAAGSIRDGQIFIFVKALLSAAKLFPSTMKKRHSLQAKRKVDTKYIKSMLYKGAPPKIPKIKF